jgi:hypothetical protein
VSLLPGVANQYKETSCLWHEIADWLSADWSSGKQDLIPIGQFASKLIADWFSDANENNAVLG